MDTTMRPQSVSKFRVSLGATLLALGIAIVIIGAIVTLIGLDDTPAPAGPANVPVIRYDDLHDINQLRKGADLFSS